MRVVRMERLLPKAAVVLVPSRGTMAMDHASVPPSLSARIHNYEYGLAYLGWQLVAKSWTNGRTRCYAFEPERK
jgi:hypothetical protein